MLHHKNCAHCGKEFTSLQKRAKYCGELCKKKADWRRKTGRPVDWKRPGGHSISASERIPDYKGADIKFLKAMRAAPECPPEGVYKDTKPLVVKRFLPPGKMGGSSAGWV